MHALLIKLLELFASLDRFKDPFKLIRLPYDLIGYAILTTYSDSAKILRLIQLPLELVNQ